MMGQANVFFRYAPEKIPYAIERYQREVRRLFDVMERQLATSEYIAGPDYSIADIALWSWIAGYSWSGIDVDGLVHLNRWMDLISARPAAARGRNIPPPSDPSKRAESARKMLA
jgi:GST-like protein